MLPLLISMTTCIAMRDSALSCNIAQDYSQYNVLVNALDAVEPFVLRLKAVYDAVRYQNVSYLEPFLLKPFSFATSDPHKNQRTSSQSTEILINYHQHQVQN